MENPPTPQKKMQIVNKSNWSTIHSALLGDPILKPATLSRLMQNVNTCQVTDLANKLKIRMNNFKTSELGCLSDTLHSTNGT